MFFNNPFPACRGVACISCNNPVDSSWTAARPGAGRRWWCCWRVFCRWFPSGCLRPRWDGDGVREGFGCSRGAWRFNVGDLGKGLGHGAWRLKAAPCRAAGLRIDAGSCGGSVWNRCPRKGGWGVYCYLKAKGLYENFYFQSENW